MYINSRIGIYLREFFMYIPIELIGKQIYEQYAEKKQRVWCIICAFIGIYVKRKKN